MRDTGLCSLREIIPPKADVYSSAQHEDATPTGALVRLPLPVAVVNDPMSL